MALVSGMAHLFSEVHYRFTPTILSSPSNGNHDISMELMVLDILTPDLVCFCLGTNDLMAPGADPDALSLELVVLAQRCRSDHGVKHVVVM